MKPTTTCCLIFLSLFSYIYFSIQQFPTTLNKRIFIKNEYEVEILNFSLLRDTATLNCCLVCCRCRQKNTHKMQPTNNTQQSERREESKEGEKRAASEHQANGFKSRKCCVFKFDYKLIGYRILKSRLSLLSCVYAFFSSFWFAWALQELVKNHQKIRKNIFLIHSEHTRFQKDYSHLHKFIYFSLNFWFFVWGERHVWTDQWDWLFCFCPLAVNHQRKVSKKYLI